MRIFAAGALAIGSLWAQYPALRSPHPFSGSRLYLPEGDAPRASVVMLHGSEGGSALLIEPEAAILATRGFAVLTLCYFDCNRGLVGPRQTLRGVDVDRVFQAAAWMRDQPHSNGKVAVYGFSRGGELALIVASLAGSRSGRPDAVIAHSPSDEYKSFFNWSWREPACWLCRQGPGRCPAGSPATLFDWNAACGPDDERRMNFSQSAWIVNGAPVAAGTRIAVEDYDGPILITVGEQDDVWPVAQTRRIEAALRGAGRDPKVEYFPGARHVFGGDDENRRRALALEFLQTMAP